MAARGKVYEILVREHGVVRAETSVWREVDARSLSVHSSSKHAQYSTMLLQPFGVLLCWKSTT